MATNKRISTARLAVLAMCLALATPAVGDGYKTMRSFVFDSGTVMDQPTPRSLVTYYRNWETLGLLAYDGLEKWVYRTTGDVDNSSLWVRARRGAQLLLPFGGTGESVLDPPSYLTTAGWEAVHEFAHRTRSALDGIDSGFNPDFLLLGDNPYSISIYLLGTNLETGSKIWENGKVELLYPTPAILPWAQNRLISAAAGINQQVNLALDHAKRSSWKGYVDVASFYQYYVNASAYFIYDDFLPTYLFGERGETSGDRLGMIESWRQLGREYSDSELARNQLVATLLSGTTWSYLLGSVDYVATGQRRAKVLRFHGFRLPDFYNYYNVNGPTLKVVSDYRVKDDALISFAFEIVTEGVNSEEITLGYDQGFTLSSDLIKYLRLGGEVGYNLESDKVFGGMEIDLDVHRNIRLTAGYRYYNLDTLSGERDIPTLKHGRDEHRFFGKLAVYF